MKTLSIFILLSIATVAHAQSITDTLPETDGKVVYYRFEKSPGKTRDEIFVKAKKWVYDYVNNVPGAVKSWDASTGRIVADASVAAVVKNSFLSSTTYTCSFKIEAIAQDNWYSFRLSDIVYTTKTGLTADELTQKSIPIETLNNDLVNNNNTATANAIHTIRFKFLDMFFNYRDFMNRPGTYNPSLADIALTDLIHKQYDCRDSSTTYSTPDNDVIDVSKCLFHDNQITELTFHMRRNFIEDRNLPIHLIFDDGSSTDYPTNTNWVKIKGRYIYDFAIDLDKNDIEIIKQKKIVQYTIADKTFDLKPSLGTSVKAWVNYLVSF